MPRSTPGRPTVSGLFSIFRSRLAGIFYTQVNECLYCNNRYGGIFRCAAACFAFYVEEFR